MDTNKCQGAKCFGPKSTGNERENEVALVACCRCSLKSSILFGVYAGVMPILLNGAYAGEILSIRLHGGTAR